MDFSNYYLLISVAAIIFLSIGIQAMIGFGSALIATPLLLSTGLPLTDIVVLTTTTSAAQRIVFGYQMKQHALIKLYMPVMLTMLVAVPIGIYILSTVSGESQEVVKQAIGILIVATVFIQLTVKIPPKEQVTNFWGYLTGFSSGVLSGFANIGGPPLVIWVYAHNWTKEQLRAAPLLLSIPMIPLQLSLLYFNFEISLKVLLFGLLLTPAVLFANQVGQKIGKKFNMKTLRIMVITSLGVIGIYYVVQPYL